MTAVFHNLHQFAIEISPKCRIVGLSNIVDREGREDISGNSPVERTHGAGVASTLVGSQLPTKVGERLEMMRIVETLLILTMAALHLSVVAGSIGSNEFAMNSKLFGRCLKEGFQVTLAVGEAIGELKTVIGLDTLDGNAFAGKMLDDFV